MAPPKRFRLSVEEHHARLQQISEKDKIAFPSIIGLKDAIAYHVDLTARILDARVKLEDMKKKFKKNSVDPKTLKPVDPAAITKQEKRIKKVAKAESDMVKILGKMSTLEKDSFTLKTKAEKESKKGLNESALRKYMKDASSLKKMMEKMVKEFKTPMASAEAGLQIIGKAGHAG